MANGETIAEIKTLLAEEGAIPTKTALRLSLDLQLQIFERQDKQDKDQQELATRVKRQEETNVVMWIQNNPKLALFITTLYLIIASLVDFKAVVAKALGIK